MIYYLWILHYSIVKGIYRKRWKGMTTSADALAFACLLLLSFFVFVLFVDKELLWDVIRRRMPLGPMVKGILALLAPIMIFLFSGKLTKQKIKTIRKVVKEKNRIKRIYSILYVSFFVMLFVLAFLIGILSRTPM
jgi:NADH:ubiquinone oxidoreductase subunit 6 (subunit J)